MSIQNYLEEMKKIQNNLLKFLDEEDKLEENFENLISNLKNQKIVDNNYKLKSFLQLLVRISKYHYRTPNFFDKIEQILQHFKDDLTKNFSNDEIFQIFKRNKRILLFLIQNGILKVDEFFVKKIIQSYNLKTEKYPEYLLPEIKPFMTEPWFSMKEIETDLPENFENNRKIGENEDLVCQMIRKDSIEEFIVFIEKNDYPLNSEIDSSIYETNSFLIKNSEDLTLIKYAAFFGACQIFKYLILNGVELNSSLWIYAVHSNNPEMIHLLEENKLEFEKEIHKKYLFESIKCHHVDITNYIQNNRSKNDEENENENDFLSEINNQSIKYYNFAFIQNIFNESSFYQFCKYDYYCIVELLLKEYKIDVNKEQIFVEKFQYNFNE